MKTTIQQLNGFDGYYLLNPKHNPVGAKRIDLKINDNLISVNYSPFRPIESSDVKWFESEKLNLIARSA